ncbi:prepilin peptidase-dependent protein [Cedecea sp.]|jgi:prepilin peptidase dependent protein A|uniref:prepilin peptidase-dependent protein n=1 Tax=Cedecea sp. TaxID=1970739 RepID=UPI0012AD403C|nr:prepilin peptidase-dependent protein [Enterobacteriaceae bacterium RIT693]
MKTNQRGFSVIEVMVVMAIVAALSASGLQGWHRWQQRAQLWQTAQQLNHFLLRLRNDANWHNRTHLLTLNKRGESWCLASRSAEGGCLANRRLVFMPEFEGISVEEMTSGLGFYGVHNTAWPGHIILRSQAGRWKVTLSVWGRTRLCELSGEKPC